MAKSPLAELSFQRRLSVLKVTGRPEARPRCTCSSELNHVGHVVGTLGRVDQMHQQTKFIGNPQTYRQPMKTSENWSDVIPWFSVGDETSGGILNSLQRSDGGLRKARKCSIAVVETAEYESCDQTFSDFFTSGTTYLTQSPQLEEAAADNATDMLLHRKLSVQIYAEITYYCNRLDDVITDRER